MNKYLRIDNCQHRIWVGFQYSDRLLNIDLLLNAHRSCAEYSSLFEWSLCVGLLVLARFAPVLFLRLRTCILAGFRLPLRLLRGIFAFLSFRPVLRSLRLCSILTFAFPLLKLGRLNFLQARQPYKYISACVYERVYDTVGSSTHLLGLLIHQLEALILASSIRLVNVKLATTSTRRAPLHVLHHLSRWSDGFFFRRCGKNDRLGRILEELLQLQSLFLNSSQGMFVGRCRSARCWEWTRRLGHGWV